MRLSDGTPQQPQLLRLLPHLILISAKEAGCFRHRTTVGEFVRKVADVHLGPGLTCRPSERALYVVIVIVGLLTGIVLAIGWQLF